MTPVQKLKHLILIRHEKFGDDPETVQFATCLTADAVDEQFDALAEEYEHQDAMGEVRGGEVETDLPCRGNRHYESKSVAAKYIDGTWIGWTYWYGGGKHGEPEEMDWIQYAYDLTVTEEEKIVTVRTFAKPEPVL